MKGTRLWNQPRSPLIQGRSRRERPFWADWLASFAVGAVVGGLVAGTMFAPDAESLVAGVSAAAAPVLIGAAAGALVGVPIASGFGWHPRWIAGGALAAVASAVAVWATQML